ncbi:MAG: K(+)-transporting ATPase subunit C [Actinobacteria bacterium]|nr:K(+)-transporting ATPase subunit C [Actinomycetota bacterium]
MLRRQLIPALRAVIVLTVLTGVLYPLAVTGIARVAFPARADRSLVRVDGKVVGSRLIGQPFTGPEWFHPRPSAAGDGYDAMASGASNLGPTNPAFLRTVEDRVAAYRAENGLGPDVAVPVDAVTASASGLDPDISLRNATLQAPRVARARHLQAAVVLGLVARNTHGPALGFLGERRVDVLGLNLALQRVR